MDRHFFGPQNGAFVERAHDGGPSALAWTIFALLLLVLLAVLISLVLDFYYRSNRPSGTLAVLDDRYARGELSRDAYLQARADLGGAAAPAAPPPSEAPTEVAPAAEPPAAPA